MTQLQRNQYLTSLAEFNFVTGNPFHSHISAQSIKYSIYAIGGCRERAKGGMATLFFLVEVKFSLRGRVGDLAPSF